MRKVVFGSMISNFYSTGSSKLEDAFDGGQANATNIWLDAERTVRRGICILFHTIDNSRDSGINGVVFEVRKILKVIHVFRISIVKGSEMNNQQETFFFYRGRFKESLKYKGSLRKGEVIEKGEEPFADYSESEKLIVKEKERE